jgi:hypothetical protein
MSYTVFSGNTYFTITDRDGYEENVFPIGIIICFNENKTVSAWESNGVPDTQNPQELGKPYFEGSWEPGEDDFISFKLLRVRPPEEVEIEIPEEEAGNYYAHPGAAMATTLREGDYVAAFSGSTLHLVSQPASHDVILSELALKGEPAPEFPRLPNEIRIKKHEEWNTFQWGPDEVDVQFNPDDEPREMKRYLVLRFYYAQNIADENRIEAWEKTEPVKNDYIQLDKPDMVGTWKHEYPQGYIFQLKRIQHNHAYSWLTYWQEGRYIAAFYDGRLEVQYFPGEYHLDEDLKHHRYSMQPLSPDNVTMVSMTEDPYPGWEALWEKDRSRRKESTDA